MFRLIILFFASAALAWGENDLPALVAKLETAGNPFAAPSGAADNGLQGLFEVLSSVSSPLFAPDDPSRGTVMFDGQPWRVGDVRAVTVGGGRISVFFRILSAPTADSAGAAGFEVADTHQQISVDLPTLPGGLAPEQALRGWLVGPRAVIAAGELPDGPVAVHWQGVECMGRTAARSRTAGLSLVIMDRPVPVAATVAHTGSCDPVRILTLDERSWLAPTALLATKPGARLVGALVLASDGRLIGILGAQGLVPAEQLPLGAASDRPDQDPKAPPLVVVTARAAAVPIAAR